MSAQPGCTTVLSCDRMAATPLRVTQENGIITLSDANTTVGYCRYAEDGEVEYLFVQSSRRRQGLALRMLALVARTVQAPLRFRDPLSPTGRALVEAYHRVSAVGRTAD